MSRQLADSVTCTTVMCSEGKAAVALMWSTFNDLTANNAHFHPEQWQAACQAIQDNLDANSHWYDMFYPFNPACCVQKNLGDQAFILTNQMLNSVGINPIPAPPPGTDWVTLALVVGGVLLLTVYAPQIKSALKK